MDPVDTSIPTTDAPVVFRGKKRKFFRQRLAEEETTEPANSVAQSIEKQDDAIAPPLTLTAADEGRSVAEIIRQRNARKSRARGVGFGTDDTRGTMANPDDELSLMIREEEQKAVNLASGGVNKRFAAQTGMTSDLVNRHM